MIALILSIILFAALYFYVKKKLNYWNERRVPNLNPKTPFGDILVCLINGKSVYDLTLEIFKKFKAEGHKYAGFYLTTGPIFIPIDLDLIRRILVKDYDYFCDRGFYFNNTKNIPFADNVFTAEQTRWKYLRDKINYLLLPLKLKNTIPIVDYYVKDYCKYLDENLGRDVDILDLSFRYTLDISCNLYMGLDEKNILENKSPIIHYAHQLSAIQLKNLFNSFLRFGTTKLTNLFTAIIYNSELHNFLYDYCTKAYNLRKNGKIKRDDALSEFIESSEVNNEPFDFEAFLGEMIILFGATVETSASSISYILYEIAKCEEYQRKLKEEIENMYKKNDEITYETINDLPYLDSLLSETFRFYPVFAAVNRCCVKDYKVPDSDLTIEKGTYVLVSLMGIHYDEELFENPYEFNPDRFMTDKNKNKHNLFAFSFGPKHCPGKRLAIMVIKLLVVGIMKNYEIELNPSTPLKLESVKYAEHVLYKYKEKILLNFHKKPLNIY